MTSKKDKVTKFGPTEAFTPVDLYKGRKEGSACTSGLTAANTKDIGKTTLFTDVESTIGPMDAIMKVSGRWAKCMDREGMSGMVFLIILDGRYYEGSYENDKKHGFGEYMWEKGKKYIGMWHQGL
jgi:hypothetical protein